MTTEVTDVIVNGVVTAKRVVYIDPMSRRFQADIPIAQATADAVTALASSLFAQSNAGAAPVTTTASDAQSLTPAQVTAAITPTVNDGSPSDNPAE